MIFGFLLAVAFDPTIYQGATSPRWVLLFVALPILVYIYHERSVFTVTHLIGSAFILWSVLSFAWSPNRLDAIYELIQMWVIVQAFIYGSYLKSLEKTFVGMALGIIVSVIIVITPIHTYIHSITSVYPHGLLGNVNMLAEAAAISIVACIVYRRYWFIPALAPAIYWPGPENYITRGAVFGLAAGVTVFVWNKSRKIGAAIAIATVIVFVVSVVFHFRLGSIEQRFDLWKPAINNLNLFGHGIGSTHFLFPFYSTDFDLATTRPNHAHNEFLEIFFEAGAVGFMLYAALIVRSLEHAGKHLPILVAFLCISLVAFPWHLPVGSFVGALLLGHIARGGDSARVLFTNGREVLRHWYDRPRFAWANKGDGNG